MKLSSKELTIILLELLITIILTILLSKLNFSINPSISFSIIGWILLVVIVISLITFIFGIIYKRIGEIDKALEEQEIKQLDLEEKLKRCEQLIDIKADIKDLQTKINNLKNGKKG